MNVDPIPHGPDELLESFARNLSDAGGPTPAPSTIRNRLVAVGHLARSLGEPPTVADLTGDAIAHVVDELLDAGLAVNTCAGIRAHLLALGHKAFILGLRDVYPNVETLPEAREPLVPRTAEELNRLFGAARQAEGSIDGILAAHWWPALLLCQLNSACSIAEALAATPAAYDRHRGTIALGRFVYQAHGLTVEALERIPGDRQRLFPWTLDAGRGAAGPFHMLLRAFKTLLYQAGLPYVRQNMFDRFRVSFPARLLLLDSINLRLPFTPRQGAPSFPRAIGRRRAEARARGELPAAEPTAPNPLSAETVYRIAIDSPRTLLSVFETLYKPLRLVAASKRTEEHLRCSINLFSAWLGYDATLESLTESRLGEFLAWRVKSGSAIPTVNSNRRDLLALANFAWRKRLIDDVPRDVPRLREYERVPRAWAMEEIGRILDAASDQPGHVCGIPAGQWWPCIILVMIDTGLRISAVLSLRTEDLDVVNGMLLARAETQKQRQDQVFRLHSQTLAEVLATRPAERERLFPLPKDSRKYLRKMFREILARAGLPSGMRDLFHKFRRTSCTYVAAVLGKASASEHLGHSSLSVTERYLDPRLARTVFAADVIPRPAWKRSPPTPPAAGELLRSNRGLM